MTGIVPIGAFLVFHLFTNASVVWGMFGPGAEGEPVRAGGVRTFQEEVGFIHSLPFLLLIEVFGLWLPIAFHAILGVYFARTGEMNTGSYAFAGNWRYRLQRLSGYVGLVFVFYHVATLRWGWTWLPLSAEFDGLAAASTMARAIRGGSDAVSWKSFITASFYMLGVSLLVYHFANGLWTAAIRWGLTVSVAAQRRWGLVCASVGVVLMAAAWASIIGFVTLHPSDAQAFEKQQHRAASGPGAD